MVSSGSESKGKISAVATTSSANMEVAAAKMKRMNITRGNKKSKTTSAVNDADVSVSSDAESIISEKEETKRKKNITSIQIWSQTLEPSREETTMRALFLQELDVESTGEGCQRHGLVAQGTYNCNYI